MENRKFYGRFLHNLFVVNLYINNKKFAASGYTTFFIRRAEFNLQPKTAIMRIVLFNFNHLTVMPVKPTPNDVPRDTQTEFSNSEK